MALQLSRCALNGTRVHFLKSKNVVVCITNAYHGRNKIGSREVVGFGINGEYAYNDRMDFPCPAIRFKEVKGDLVQLKEKEKGDWKKLSIEEKKTRKDLIGIISFCKFLMDNFSLQCIEQAFAELSLKCQHQLDSGRVKWLVFAS